MNGLLVLSSYHIQPLLEAKLLGKRSAIISTDLGISQSEISIEGEFVRLPNDLLLSWGQIQEIFEAESSCFIIKDQSIQKIKAYSPTTNRQYSLFPTTHAPTFLLSGLPMHRIKDIDPHQDTLNKINTIKPVIGRVLDTATGLGYTAIEASRTAELVVTIELDPIVLDIAKLNPWSRDLFNNPKIIQVIGDSYEKIREYDNRFFTRIIHDPPMISLAGDLYSGMFYTELARVISNSGKLFHYIGDLHSNSGMRVAKGVRERLLVAGFRRIKNCYNAFGLVASK